MKRHQGRNSSYFFAPVHFPRLLFYKDLFSSTSPDIHTFFCHHQQDNVALMPKLVLTKERGQSSPNANDNQRYRAKQP